ncbi:MAG: NUDIX hydrolase [Deltaproteobacteria bacterium]|nr:NUDIX hydrolase [Deltaproteobacteria bacterium]
MPQAGNQKSKSTVHLSEEIYKGRQFSFYKEHVTLPHNVETEMAFVRHPGSAVIVPLFQDQTIGVIKQFRHAINDTIYEIPAGTIDGGESPIQCAKRELEEETGYAASKFTALGKTLLLPAYSDEISYIYLARDMTKTEQTLDEDEIIEVHQYHIHDILQMIDTGIIIDALSILAILRATRYLGFERK